MSRAPVDLPDPLEAAEPAGNVNADELLAELAGDAIDRLLAEADLDAAGDAGAEGEVHPADAEAGRPGEPLPAADPTAADLPPADAPSANLPSTEAAPTVPSGDDAPAPAGTDSALAVQFDELFAHLNQTPPPDPGGSPPESPADPAGNAAGAPPHASPSAAHAAGTAERRHPTSFAELAALAEAAEAGDGPPHVAPLQSHPPAEAADDEPPLPVLLRPLEWLDAPFALCPGWVRETIGKAAIVTLVNAVAVLLYVLIFRGG